MGCMVYPFLFDFRDYRHVSRYLLRMEVQEGVRMNWQGWVFMLIAWSFVSSLFFYSFYRILFNDARHKQKDNSKEG